jgi:hypothetical protein
MIDMSTVIARDIQASTQLVYTWPFPIGAECHVQCSVDDIVIMCPAWVVGNRLGPGQHHWRTPDPMRPSTAYFVSTCPTEVDFDLVTSFPMPLTMQPVRVRAMGALTVRCADPAMLVAQFVGLPFYDIDRGLRKSVARSVERILARLLVRRTVMTGSPMTLIDGSVRAAIADELVAYHPTGGAVFGLEFGRLLSLDIAVDDGQQPLAMLGRVQVQVKSESAVSTIKTEPMVKAAKSTSSIDVAPPTALNTAGVVAGGIKPKPELPPPMGSTSRDASKDRSQKETIRGRASLNDDDHNKSTGKPSTPPISTVSGSVASVRPSKTPSLGVPAIVEDSTSQTLKVPVTPVALAAPETKAAAKEMSAPLRAPSRSKSEDERGAILAIGGVGVGTSNAATGEVSTKIPTGRQVLVQGNNGLMQSAVVKQLLAGYYELEVGATGEVVWVPMAHVVPQ